MHRSLIMILFLSLGLLAAANNQTTAEPAAVQTDELVAHGKYLVEVAGCVECHTPLQEAYADFTNLTGDQQRTLAYLRSVPAVVNEVKRDTNTLTVNLPPLPVDRSIIAPEPADTAARGRYLMTGVLACTDCHTPLDPATGAPVMAHYLGGGQPFEGPWGIVYGGNLTPHETAGLGAYSDAEIKRVLISGVNKENRRVIVMPWQVFSNLSGPDLDAVVYYLRNDVASLDTEVPAAAIGPEFMEHVMAQTDAASEVDLNPATLLTGAVIFIATAGLVMVFRRHRFIRDSS